MTESKTTISYKEFTIPILNDIYAPKGQIFIIYKYPDDKYPDNINFSPYIDKMSIPSPEIEKERVDKILKMKKEKKLSDIKAIIVNFKQENLLENIKTTLNIQFN
ncbi:hypothetical protein M0Q50_06410 [bacterium]|jgi:hypothetical protein|nr:hypothetical protein [bacterium]